MNFEVLYDNFDEMHDEPYPKLENIKEDYRFGKMLYDSFGGSYGELTTILQYVYENVTFEKNKELQNVLIKIAMDEMNHLKILGDLLVKLGFTAYYMGSRNNKWCSDRVKYKFSCVEDMLEYNIKGEKFAIQEYKRLIENTEDKCIKDILNRIIKDEENHIRIFSSLLNKKDDVKNDNTKGNMKRRY